MTIKIRIQSAVPRWSDNPLSKELPENTTKTWSINKNVKITNATR